MAELEQHSGFQIKNPSTGKVVFEVDNDGNLRYRGRIMQIKE